jgi:beta-phosphoglucomutase-like phosphatase (HAD superfamily)
MWVRNFLLIHNQNITKKKKDTEQMITTRDIAIKTFTSHQGEFAEVTNPSYVYPPVEFYPLAAPIKKVSQLKAALMDMDGTTTTTELLCIYALENMVRRMSGLLTKEQWLGLDHHLDLPFIIGNSTTKHVEYLIGKYGHLLVPEHMSRGFLLTAKWTLTMSPDKQRRADVIQNIRKLNISEVIEQIQAGISDEELIKNWLPKISNLDFTAQVGVGIDIYYEIYHRILLMLKDGKGDEVRLQVFGSLDSEENLISPMPAIPVLLPLLKGWLGPEAALLSDYLSDEYEKTTGKTLSPAQRNAVNEKLAQLGAAFEKQPVKLALVTSSIFYEADIIVTEILGVVKSFIAKSTLSENRKKVIMNACDDYHNVYDAFVTASDSSEIRLKPHRDLYSIALHKAGLLPVDFDKVIGFEDSQSGTVAMRAAGIGCCIAVPFAQTLSHDLRAATHILPGGVPEAIIDFNLFTD